MAPNPRYHAEVTPGERWAMRHLPGYSRFYRFMLMWQANDKILELVRADIDWPDFPRTANAASAARREYFANWIDQQVGHDPELAAKVTPDYPPMTKRMLQDNGSWLRCLSQPHVDLVNDKIIGIDSEGVLTASRRYDVDVIVLATGFRASELLLPMEIIGRDGVSIAAAWGGKPAAYNGISVPGFPNFFIMAGPGTGLAHAGSVITMSELEMRYIGDALRRLIDDDVRSIEPTPAAHERYRGDLQREVSTLRWGHRSIKHSWYKSADGNVYILCPWRLVDYWNMTRGVKVEDHVLRR
jgi:4-hydroxyacetophenone monooxygenase